MVLIVTIGANWQGVDLTRGEMRKGEMGKGEFGRRLSFFDEKEEREISGS